MSFHSDTLCEFRANQSMLSVLNAEYLAEKQHIPISYADVVKKVNVEEPIYIYLIVLYLILPTLKFTICCTITLPMWIN